MRWAVILSFATACGFSPTPATGSDDDGNGVSDAGSGMANVDATVTSPDAPNGAFCYGTGFMMTCFTSAPTGDVSLNSQTLDTDSDPRCSSVTTKTCLIAAATIEVTGTVQPTGKKPLVLLAVTQVTIDNTLDVSSTAAGHVGAGADPSLCATLRPGAFDSGGGGGGAGGSFGSSGGDGGTGDTNNNGLPNGTAGGGSAADPLPTPTALHGGCSGSKGGEGDASDDGSEPGGAAGVGGGAIGLVAGTAIVISGALYASGAGGGATPGNSQAPCGGSAGYEQGGGGAGAGGMVVLDAPTITFSGRIAANGGAGGGGGGCYGGQPGGDGTTDAWNVEATGGAGGDSAGTGGGGTVYTTTQKPTGASNDAGAGGGGGGLGVLWIDGTVTSNSDEMSPAPLAH